MRILIVEDNDDDYFLLSKMLEPYGFSERAANGLKAVEVFLDAHKIHESYDVIFLDIMMPKMDGQEVLVKIREWEKSQPIDTRQLPIVMITSITETDTVLKSFEDGCQHYFPKPFDQTELEELMNRMGIQKGE